MDTFEHVAAERRDLADLIESLDEDQLAVASLCDGWTVRDVAAHLVMPLVTPLPRFAWAILKARGSFDRANLALTQEVAESPLNLSDALREHATSRFVPPGGTPEAPLTDLLIHGQDMRRPLGLHHEIAPERLRLALAFLISPAARRGFVAHGVPSVQFIVDDLALAYGRGDVVHGSGEAIMMALSGRRAALSDLSGDGVAALLEWI